MTPSAQTPSARFRQELRERGGERAARCFQCATCSAVCDLAPPDAPFPRRQMLWAQWGLEEKLIGDPSIWLCHQCNDCTQRCPRDARPGDVMQTLRAMTVERLATPRVVGKLVADAGSTWPILLGLPMLFWAFLLYAVHGMTIPAPPLAYHDVVPWWMLYSVYFPLTGLAAFAVWRSGKRFWGLMGQHGERKGSFYAAAWEAAKEIMSHKRFGSCGPAQPRRWGHWLLVWGFAGAALTSALLIVAAYIQKEVMPLQLDHPYKILGNASAVFLVLGGGWLYINRLRDGEKKEKTGKATAFDNFFLGVVLLVIVSGCFVEAGRLWFEPAWAVGLYIVHLGAVFCLFITLPYSKFAHLIYRTLAMVHQKMVER